LERKESRTESLDTLLRDQKKIVELAKEIEKAHPMRQERITIVWYPGSK
jgi:hypothetical protein